MRAFWLVAEQDSSALASTLDDGMRVLQRLDTLHMHTRRLFSKLAMQEDLVFKAMRKGKKFFRLSGHLNLAFESDHILRALAVAS